MCRLNRSDVGIYGQLLADSQDTLVGSRRMLSGNVDLTTFSLMVVLGLVILRELTEDGMRVDGQLYALAFARIFPSHSRR